MRGAAPCMCLAPPRELARCSRGDAAGEAMLRRVCDRSQHERVRSRSAQSGKGNLTIRRSIDRFWLHLDAGVDRARSVPMLGCSVSYHALSMSFR